MRRKKNVELDDNHAYRSLASSLIYIPEHAACAAACDMAMMIRRNYSCTHVSGVKKSLNIHVVHNLNTSRVARCAFSDMVLASAPVVEFEKVDKESNRY